MTSAAYLQNAVQVVEMLTSMLWNVKNASSGENGQNS